MLAPALWASIEAPQPNLAERLASRAGALATRALIAEPEVWPRFGLVGPGDPGAHRDMSYDDLVTSAQTLEPFFKQSAWLGLRLPLDDIDAALVWRDTGRDAEAEMYRAVRGVNTHKGAIFLLGLLAFSWGRLLRAHRSVSPRAHFIDGQSVLDMAHRCLAWRLREELRASRAGLSETYGQWTQRRFQWGGMRHTVVTDFAGLRDTLRRRRQLRTLPTQMGLAVARHRLLVFSRDSNLVKRAGWQKAQQVLGEARNALRMGSAVTPQGLSALRRMDRGMSERGWSASGTGDLLAAYLFLDYLERRTPWK